MTPNPLRTAAIQAREALPAAVRQEYSRRIVQRILDSAVFQQARTILSYQAVRAEVDLSALDAAALALGKIVAWPCCTGPGVLEAWCPPTADAFVPGRYGIPEPVRAIPVPPETLELILCPCTAFDAAGHRLGMGGGYYDRWLPACTRAVIAAAAFDVQRVPTLTPAPWDVPMALVFTESKIYGGSTYETGSLSGLR